LYQEFRANTKLFIIVDSAHQEVGALAPWMVLLWLVDVDCEFYDSAPTTSLPKPPNEPTTSVTTLRQFFAKDTTALLSGLTKAHPFIRTGMKLKSRDGGQLLSALFDCVVTLCIRARGRYHKLIFDNFEVKLKNPVRLAKAQRMTSSIVCGITCELARHSFK
jgi:hypothetical protein